MSFLKNFAMGAGLMYWLDPDLGRRRRARLSDKAQSRLRRWQRAARRTQQDIVHRSRGLYYEAAHHLQPDHPDDQVLTARIRAQLGRVVSHPSAIKVYVRDGNVTLSGQALRQEVAGLLSATRHVRGVKHVDAILDVHQTAADVPALQGGTPRTGTHLDILQDNWSRATRALLGATGAIIAINGFARQGFLAKISGLFGAGLLVRATSNMNVAQLTGIGAGRRAVDVTKSIRINAPVDEVFDFWQNYENFPLFMHNVRAVLRLVGGRSRWRIAGPAGTDVQFDAFVTDVQPNRRIAWRTDASAPVASAGAVRFTPIDDNTTQLFIQMSYNPPAGAIGHAVATLFGADPKTEMDEDLARMKTLIEKARFPHDAAQHASGRPS